MNESIKQSNIIYHPKHTNKKIINTNKIKYWFWVIISISFFVSFFIASFYYIFILDIDINPCLSIIGWFGPLLTYTFAYIKYKLIPNFEKIGATHNSVLEKN